jgi:CheY-like chemotaxis protein
MRKTVLVVEDDPDLRDAILDVLESAGLDAIPAGNGREALDALRDLRKPALILLDLKMLVMDGVEFRHRLLETPGVSEVPIVLMSGDPKSQLPNRTPAPAGSLRKPFREEDLLRIVGQYCAD